MKTVLVLAATDSCGGAGLGADIRAVAANGAHAATVVTAVTAQSSQAVKAVFPIPAGVVAAQLKAVAGDLTLSAVKSGVVGSSENVAVIAGVLTGLRAPYVLDPVAMATSGKPLANPATIDTIAARLFPLATLLTPNGLEASALTGFPVRTRDDAARAGRALLASGCGAVLVKGGHLEEEDAVDVLITRDSVSVFASPRLAQPNTHGTGCTLASAIAARLANGYELAEAVRLGREFVRRAIQAGYRVGAGPGPVDQLWALRERVEPVHASPREATQ